MAELLQTAYRAQVIDLSRAQLMRSTDIPGKTDKRVSILADHPEYQLRVNTERLRRIIPYIDFRCHPKSSVARGTAIRGSDIDGALVVLPSRLPEEAQFAVELAFVQELRHQGFDIYHVREDPEYRERLLERFRSGSDEEKKEVIPELVKRINDTVSFYTVAELEEMTKENELPMMAMIYLAGTSIPAWLSEVA